MARDAGIFAVVAAGEAKLEALQHELDACVRCGLCLPACPTFALLGEEPESPRGRIALIAQALASGGPLAATSAAHLQSCTGCMACVSACPAGVRFDRLIGAVRPASAVRAHPAAAPRERLAQAAARRLITDPRAGRAMAAPLRIAQRHRRRPLPPALASLQAALPPAPRPRRSAIESAGTLRAVGESRGRVGLLLGCVSRGFLPELADASARVLSAEGYDVLTSALSGCCGAIDLHDGAQARARAHAQATLDAFAALGGVEHVVADAGLCGATLKSYGELLGGSRPQAFATLVSDVCELLTGVPARAPRAPLRLRVAYFPDCQLRHVQHRAGAARTLLSAIPELELVELPPDRQGCCGGVGLYPLREPRIAGALGRQAAQALLDSGVQAIVATSFGCVAQLRNHTAQLGRPLPVLHPVQLLDASIAAAAA